MPQIDIPENILDKLRILCDFLFFDQYKDMATFPRFEECFSVITKEMNINLENVFKDLCGEKRKYITFRRFIKGYLKYTKNEVSEDTKKFFDKFLNEIMKNDGDGTGQKEEEAVKYSTKNGEKMNAISKLSVITDENKEKIKGFQIYYDDFFKNDLFLNKQGEKFYVSLEINLPVLDVEQNKEFPDINMRDGITHIFGTVSDKINFLGFKCRSGKTSFIGQPSGNPFVYGGRNKQFKSVKVEIKNNELSYFEPHFEHVDRNNPYINKENSEITQSYLDQDEPIYEENELEKIENKEDLSKSILQPLISDKHFFNPRFIDAIAGRDFKEFCSLMPRFINKDKLKGKKKKEFKFNSNDLIKEAGNFFEKKKKRREEKGNKKYIMFTPGIQMEESVEMDIPPFQKGNNMKNRKPRDFLLNRQNFDNLMKTLGDEIGKNFEGRKGLMESKLVYSPEEQRGPGGPDGYGGFGGVGGFGPDRGRGGHGGDRGRGRGGGPRDMPHENMQRQFTGQGGSLMDQITPQQGQGQNPEQQNIIIGEEQGEIQNEEKPILKSSLGGKLKAPSKQKYVISTNGQGTYGFQNENELQNYFNNIQNNYNNYYNQYYNNLNNFNNYYNNRNYNNMYNYNYNNNNNNYYNNYNVGGYNFTPYGGYYNYYNYYPQQQQQQQEQEKKKEEEKKLSAEEIKKLTEKAQTNWKNVTNKYKKNSAWFTLKAIGGVIKAISFLKDENASNLSLEEKVRLYEILNENQYIVSMLSKAHQEALRREKERKKLEEDKQKLEQMKKEEEKRKREEEKRLQEELKRQQEEERIAAEKRKLEEIEKKRKEEERKRQEEIKKEQDKQRKLELQREEERKKAEAEKKRLEEERKKKELELQQKKLEEENRKAEEKRRKEEEEKRRKEEEEKKKAELERIKKEEEEAQKKQAELALNRGDTLIKNLTADDLPEINAKLEMIEKLLPKKSGDDLEKLKLYYEDLLKDKNAIIEALNNEQKKKIQEQTKYDPEEELRKEEEKRKKLIEEENKKIEELKKKEKEKEKEKTKIVSISNLDIPKDTKIYRKQKLNSQGSVFTDDLFQPIKKNLCPVDNYGRWNYPTDITEDDLEGWENISWARAEDIFNNKNYQVFYKGIENDDIIQGGLGDCYFLSAIAALCKFPKMIEKLFYIKEKSQEHCYGCYYRISGIWKLVLVDDYFPCYGRYGKNFAFSSTNGNELWVVLLEKAWAKLNGNYAKAIGGEPHEVFDAITNAYSEKIRVDTKNPDLVWNKFLEAEKKGFIMTAGTSGDTYNLDLEDKGLVPGHAYTCLGVKEVTTNSGKVKLVHLRNPWGNGEWSGDWCDSSRKWTPALKAECEVEKTDDGSFWMSYKDFLIYFLVAGICHLYENYVYTFLHYPKTIVNNGPMVTKLTVNDNNNHCYVMIHQKNPRFLLLDGTYQKCVINYLMLVDSNNNYIKAASNCEMNCCVEVTLNKGTYYLITDINYRFIQGGKLHGCTISCYSQSPVGITQEKGKDIKTLLHKGLIDYAHKELQSQDFAGGKIYQSKKSNSEFPFNFILFDNTNGTYDVTLTDTLQFKSSNKCADFYLEDNSKANSLSKTVCPGEIDMFIHMPYSYNSLYSYQLQSSAKQSTGKKTSGSQSGSQAKMSTSEIQNKLFSQNSEDLDNKGLLKQYVLQADGGYYIGLENGSTKSLNLKLNLEGLYEENHPNSDSVVFTIGGKTRKIFYVKVKPNYNGGISFLFNYA